MSDLDHPLTQDTATIERNRIGPSSPPGAAAIVIGGRSYHPRQVTALALIAVGFVGIAVGWFGVSGASQVWEQMPYIISGGIGGAGLIAVGIVVYLSYEHLADRTYVEDLLRQQEALELGLAAEFDALATQIRDLGAGLDGTTNRRRAPISARS